MASTTLFGNHLIGEFTMSDRYVLTDLGTQMSGLLSCHWAGGRASMEWERARLTGGVEAPPSKDASSSQHRHSAARGGNARCACRANRMNCREPEVHKQIVSVLVYS